jgi:hypothetical protein
MKSEKLMNSQININGIILILKNAYTPKYVNPIE